MALKLRIVPTGGTVIDVSASISVVDTDDTYSGYTCSYVRDGKFLAARGTNGMITGEVSETTGLLSNITSRSPSGTTERVFIAKLDSSYYAYSYSLGDSGVRSAAWGNWTFKSNTITNGGVSSIVQFNDYLVVGQRGRVSVWEIVGADGSLAFKDDIATGFQSTLNYILGIGATDNYVVASEYNFYATGNDNYLHCFSVDGAGNITRDFSQDVGDYGDAAEIAVSNPPGGGNGRVFFTSGSDFKVYDISVGNSIFSLLNSRTDSLDEFSDVAANDTYFCTIGSNDTLGKLKFYKNDVSVNFSTLDDIGPVYASRRWGMWLNNKNILFVDNKGDLDASILTSVLITDTSVSPIAGAPNNLLIDPRTTLTGLLDFDGSVGVQYNGDVADPDIRGNRTIKWKMYLDSSTGTDLFNLFVLSDSSTESFQTDYDGVFFYNYYDGSWLIITDPCSATAAVNNFRAVPTEDLIGRTLRCEIKKQTQKIIHFKINDVSLVHDPGVPSGSAEATIQIGVTSPTDTNFDGAFWDFEIINDDTDTRVHYWKGYPSGNTDSGWEDQVGNQDLSIYERTGWTANLRNIEIISDNVGSKLLISLQSLPLPDAPTLYRPLDTSIIGTVDPSLSWYIVSGADTYWLQVDSSVQRLSEWNTSGWSGSVSVSGRNLDELIAANAGDYVESNNIKVDGSTSVSLSFNVTQYDDVPYLKIYEFGSVDISTDYFITDGANNITYRPGAGAEYIYLRFIAPNDYVWASIECSAKTYIDASGITDLYYDVVGLDSSAIHFWKVAATNTSGTGDWSETRVFYTPPGFPTEYLEAYWSFEESSGTVVDQTDNSNDLGTNSGITYSQTGKINNCISVSSTGYLQGTSDTVGTTTVSISAWIKTPDVADNKFIFDCTAISWNNGYGFAIDTGGRPSMWIYQSGSGQILYADAPAIDDDTWHHIVITHNGTSGLSGTKFYIDGSLVTTGGLNSKTTGSNVGGTFRIGNWTASTDYGFNGELDEMGIWSTVLSATDVSILYNNGDGMAYPGP